MSVNNLLSDRDSDFNLSRRDFLQYFGMGIVGLLLPETLTSKPRHKPVNRIKGVLLGRVTQNGFKLHQSPDRDADVIEVMDFDTLMPLTGITVGEDTTSRNHIWYELDRRGYAHSSRIQPVINKSNTVQTKISEDGCLGEITVPFVDAYAKINQKRSPIYRFYFASTFWVIKSEVDDDGIVWYQLLDDRNYTKFYVPANTVRLVPDSELTAISPNIPPEEKKIVIDLPTQSLTAYESDKVVFMSRISSGVLNPEGGYYTPKGYFRTTRKRPCRHMVSAASEFGTGFDLPGVPWVSYFTSNGVAIHGTYWHNDYGVPHSHGCINMTPNNAKWVYRWTNPTVPPEHYYYADNHGTRIIVQ